MSYNVPKVFPVPNPVGLDRAIGVIQTNLASVTWLDKIFGRAWIMLDYDGEKARRVTTSDGIQPKVFESSSENGKVGNYYTAYPNDSLGSYCFFVTEGKEEFVNYQFSPPNTLNRPMSLIVWCRLNKIDHTKKYVFTEELKEEIYHKLRLPSIEITSYTDEVREVWSGFDWQDQANFRYPNVGFRIYFNLSYTDKSC